MNAHTRTQQTIPLFTKYGGLRALRNVIFDFYDRVLDSDIIGPFFDDVDMAKLVDHQTKFFTSLLGGPADFGDRRLAMAHEHLDVSHAHFDEITSILTATLWDAGFTRDDLDTVIAAVEARRSLIVKTR